MVDRFGVQAALGRQPTPKEMRRMVLVERAARAYTARERAASEADWANANPADFDLLTWLMKAVR